jgi:hypothetical protein
MSLWKKKKTRGVSPNAVPLYSFQSASALREERQDKVAEFAQNCYRAIQDKKRGLSHRRVGHPLTEIASVCVTRVGLTPDAVFLSCKG